MPPRTQANVVAFMSLLRTIGIAIMTSVILKMYNDFNEVTALAKKHEFEISTDEKLFSSFKYDDEQQLHDHEQRLRVLEHIQIDKNQ